MDISRFDDLRLALQLAGIHPKKGLGQHFLIDRPSLDQVVKAADITSGDTVLEIGPGLGVMTGLLVRTAGKVVAVETDSVLAELLKRDAPDNLEVVEQDILEYDLRQLGPDYKVAANLPYYLTARILRLLLESPNPPLVSSLLVQKEVAERVTAEPGKMSVLAVSVQYYTEAVIVGTVGREKFWPPPKVDSAIIQLRRRPKPMFEADTRRLFRLVKAGFGERRKQLKNSLAGGLNATTETTEKLLKQSGIDPSARAQTLGLDDWRKLYQVAEDSGLLVARVD